MEEILIYVAIAIIGTLILWFLDNYKFCWKCKRFEKINIVEEKVYYNGIKAYHYKSVCKKCGRVLYDKWLEDYEW